MQARRGLRISLSTWSLKLALLVLFAKGLIACDLSRPRLEIVQDGEPVVIHVSGGSGELTDGTGRVIAIVKDGEDVVLDNLPNGTHRLRLGKTSLDVVIDYPNGYTLEPGTAADYWQRVGGSPAVDVSVYDRNEDGGLTNIETRILRFFKTLQDDGFTADEIQAFVDAFPLFDAKTGKGGGGLFTIQALEWNYAAFKEAKQYNPSLTFTPESIGWIPIRAFSDFYRLPSRRVILEGVPPLTPYPPSDYADAPGLLNHNPYSEPFISGFDVYCGYDGLGAGEVDDESSLDLFAYLTYTEWVNQVVDSNYYVGLPGTWKVVGIAPDYRDYPQELAPHTDFTIHFARYFFPADRNVYDPPVPSKTLYMWEGHVLHPDNPTARPGDLPYQAGDYLPFKYALGKVNNLTEAVGIDLGFYFKEPPAGVFIPGGVPFDVRVAGGRVERWVVLDPVASFSPDLPWREKPRIAGPVEADPRSWAPLWDRYLGKYVNEPTGCPKP